MLRAQGMNPHVGIWSRGIDRTIFNREVRDLAWRRGLGIDDAEPVIGFVGRLVAEKGLDMFSDAVALLRARGVPHRVLVIGEGPARAWFAERLPGALVLADSLHDAITAAVDDPGSTRLDPATRVGPTWAQAARMHADILRSLP